MFKRNRLKRHISTLGEDISNEAKKPCLEKECEFDGPRSAQSQISVKQNLEQQVIPNGRPNEESIEKHKLADVTNVEAKLRYEEVSNDNDVKSIDVISRNQKITENDFVSTEINHNLSQPKKCLQDDKEMKSDDNSMEMCPVCKENIFNMDAKLKEDHLNKCFNNEELTEKQKNKEKECIEKEMKKILPCPICGKQLKTYNSRVSHLKKCSADCNIEPTNLMQMIMKQSEERDALLKEKFPGSLRDKLMTALNTASLKKFKQAPTKRNKLKFEEPKTKFDEDVQLAIALSTSMDVESEEIKMVDKKPPQSNLDAFQVLASASNAQEKGGRRNKKTRPPDLLHPLMAISFEDCMMLIKEKFSKMLSEKSSLMTLSHVNKMKTGVRRSNLIEKYKSDRCLWGMNSFSDSESKSSLKLFLVPEIFQTRITDSKEVAFLIDWRKKLLPPQRQQSTQVPFTQTTHLLADLATDYTQCCDDDDQNNVLGDCDSNNFSREASSVHVPVEKKSLMCYLPMVDNPILSDLKLILDGDHVFHVHKFVLLVRCPKFYEAISDKSEYLLETFSVQTIRSFFEFIYASVVSLNESTVHPLLQLAQRFQILELVDICRDYLKSQTRVELFENGLNEDIIKNCEEQDAYDDDGGSEEDDTSLDEVYEYMSTQRKLKQKRIEVIEIDSCSEEVELSLEKKSEPTFQGLSIEQPNELSKTSSSEKINVSDFANHVNIQKESYKIKDNYLTNNLVLTDEKSILLKLRDNSILKSLDCVDSTILREFEQDMDCLHDNIGSNSISNNSPHLDVGEKSPNPAMFANRFDRSCSPDLFSSRNESLALDTPMQVKDKVTCKGSILCDYQKQQSIFDSHVGHSSPHVEPKSFKKESEVEKEGLFDLPEQSQCKEMIDSVDPSDVLLYQSPSDGKINRNMFIKNDEGWVDNVWEDFQESFYAATSSPLYSNVPLSQPILQETPRRGQWGRSLSQYETPSRRVQTNIRLNASFSPPTDVSCLDSPDHTDDPDVNPCTPSTKQIGAQKCLTPMLKYENMNTPILKEHCHNFGVRALPKSKMVKVLKNIYYGTHPNAQRTPAVVKKKASKVTRKGRKSKETNPETSEPILVEDKKTTKLETAAAPKLLAVETNKAESNHAVVPKHSKKVFTFKKKQPIKHFTSPSRLFISSGNLNPPSSNLPIISDASDVKPHSGTNQHSSSSQLSKNLSGSVGDDDDEDEELDDERRCIEEEHFRSDDEDDCDDDDDGEIAPSQKSRRKYEKLTDEQKKEKLFEFFQEEKQFLKILHYEPFELNELADSIKSKNMKVSKQFLIEYMDEKNILFTTRGNNKNGHHRPKTASNNYKMPSKMYNELI